MMKVVVILLAAAAAAAGGTIYWQRTHADAVVDPTAAGTAVVERGSIIESVQSTGLVSSNLDVQIKVQASGVIKQLGPKDRTKQFDVGDTVKKGDLLIQIDPIDEQRAYNQVAAQVDISQAKYVEAQQNLVVAQQQLDQARTMANANLLSAQAALEDDQKKAARRKELWDQKLGTEEDYDTAADAAAQAQAAVDNAKVAIEQLKTQEYQLQIKAQDVVLAKAQLKADQVALEEAQQQLDYCTVNAPMDGVVTTLSIQEGTIISSATSVVGGSAALVLSDLSHLFILADVDESEIGAVQQGQDVEIKADAFQNVKFSGKVVRIAPQGVNTSNVVTFEVKIEVTSKNKALLKPQMTADVNIVQERKENVLLVPISAVTRKDRKEMVTVQHADGTTEDRQVKTGITDGTNDEIIEGVNEGETVVLHKGPGDSRWNGGQGQGQGRGGGGGGRRGMGF
jgi:HlyD family secretion protein